MTKAAFRMNPPFSLAFAFLLPLIGAQTWAQTPHWGPCPEPAVQPAFNLKQFMGRWFEIARLPAQFEHGRCIETNFTLKPDGSIRLISSEIDRGELRRIVGTGVVEDPRNPAKLGITYAYVLPYSPYWILSTDYVSVAVLYSCTNILNLFHVDFAWILGRKRTLPVATMTKVYEIFTNNSIDVSRMKPTRQTACGRNPLILV